MLPWQPLRFLLADDPGAGKTIMAGLLIKELMLRGDLERCLIVAPGSLTEQWQDELAEKFGLECVSAVELFARGRQRTGTLVVRQTDALSESCGRLGSRRRLLSC